MDVEIRANGSLEMIISKPKGPVQAAALTAFMLAVEKGQKVDLVKTSDSIVLSVEA